MSTHNEQRSRDYSTGRAAVITQKKRVTTQNERSRDHIKESAVMSMQKRWKPLVVSKKRDRDHHKNESADEYVGTQNLEAIEYLYSVALFANEQLLSDSHRYRGAQALLDRRPLQIDTS